MGHEFKIDLEDETPPIHRPLYKLSPLELEEAKKQIQDILEHGFIRSSKSPYGPPCYLCQRKIAAFGFALITIGWISGPYGNKYPVPLPEEMRDRLGGARVFSKIDLKSGYWQKPVHE